jgi:hypothetical protein
VALRLRVTAIAEKQKKLEKKASKTAKAVTEAGPVQRLVEAQEELQQEGVSIKKLLLNSLIVGVTFGSVFQVTHNNGLLPEYDVLPFKVGPFLESGLVPLVLAPIWVLYGYLYPLLDKFFADDATEEAIERASSFGTLANTWILLAGQFILSDVLYLQGTEHWKIYPVMAACTAFNWLFLDRTKTGLLLGSLLAVGAPLGEAVIANGLHWWHYSRPDTPVLNVCYWTAFCYASYAYGVGNYARWEVERQRKQR